MQLTTSRYLEHIGGIRLLDVHGDIRLDLLEQAITQMARRDKLPLTACERTRIDTEGHGERRFINIDRRQCLRILRVRHRIADAHIAEPRQSDDLTHPRFVDFDALEPLIHIDLADLCLRLMIAADHNNILIGAHRTTNHAPNGNATNIVIRFERRHHHLQRPLCIALRRRNLLHDGLHQRLEIIVRILHVKLGDTITRCRIDHGKIELVIIRIQLHKELQNLIVHIVHALIRAVDLVDDNNRLQPLFECLAQNILRLRHWTLKRIDEQQNTVHHVENALHLTAEVRMTRSIYDIDLDPIIEDRRILRKNRNPTLALDIA